VCLDRETYDLALPECGVDCSLGGCALVITHLFTVRETQLVGEYPREQNDRYDGCRNNKCEHECSLSLVPLVADPRIAKTPSKWGNLLGVFVVVGGERVKTPTPTTLSGRVA
jgi:hypothetical protein